MKQRHWLLMTACGLLLAACGDPANRCADAIQGTQQRIDAARAKEQDVDRINRLAVVAAHLMSAEVDRTAGDYKACFAEVGKAKEGLAEFEKSD